MRLTRRTTEDPEVMGVVEERAPSTTPRPVITPPVYGRSASSPNPVARCGCKCSTPRNEPASSSSSIRSCAVSPPPVCRASVARGLGPENADARTATNSAVPLRASVGFVPGAAGSALIAMPEDKPNGRFPCWRFACNSAAPDGPRSVSADATGDWALPAALQASFCRAADGTAQHRLGFTRSAAGGDSGAPSHNKTAELVLMYVMEIPPQRESRQ